MSSGFHAAQERAETPTRRKRVTRWRVIHACEYARDVLPLIEGQVAAGMRPFIVTPQGAGTAELYLSGGRQEQPRSLSLLRSWQDVRNWRKSLLDCAPETTSDIVHAHCFAAGMAAVRSCSSVVYDLSACIEEMAVSAGLCEPGSWMGRSFRVAEQFVLSRAEAVVVHCQGMKEAALERGASAESTFLIPDPIDNEEESPLFPDSDFLVRRFELPPDAVSFYIPQFAGEGAEQLSAEAVSALEGFALASNELPRFKLLVEAPESARKTINEHAGRLGIAAHVALVHQLDALETMQCASVIVALGEIPANPVAARLPSEVCVRSLWLGKSLLAADVPRNRDVTPEGRGCLWFESGNPRDLAYRMAYLGRKAEFRAALGAAGRMFIFETRNCGAVGEKYDEAYRHAAGKKKSGGLGPGMTRLETAENWG
ncbi:MAG TPA: glycosyltransferase [Candidatus Angelobacter sp.]|nr:glycosyltransferase [Candidatus Angelobacter sp.]